MMKRNLGRKISAAQTLLVSSTIVVITLLLAAIPGTPQPPQQPATKAPPTGEIKINSKDGLKYVWIPPGTFMMGCSPGDRECSYDEKPAHQVTISKGFRMGQTEVTVAAYQRFASATNRQMPAAPYFNSGWAKTNMPIVNVSWIEADAYCQWSGGRLPTEAEWEYAARAGSTDARYGPLDEVAWYSENTGNRTHDVAQRRANAWGLYDMLGNAWEWVNDSYGGKYYRNSPTQDPEGPHGVNSRVLRGGSCYNDAGYVRVSIRLASIPVARDFNLGLRCVAPANIP